MNQTAAKFVIATAILAAPAETALNASAHAAAVQSQPSKSSESVSTAVTAYQPSIAAASETKPELQSRASAGIVELVEAEPSFTFNAVIKRLA
ncbi:hypothetical protein [Paenibacillus chitinolyticus]|uniref:hypothetical protein n=1 Tax=Paenibacillus chitinolyticus TaxID=79263 RepID=UPI0036721ACD